MSTSENIKNILKNIPEKPGVYFMKNNVGEIIYIGKAISLKKRVRQYFGSNVSDIKVLSMVSNVADIDFIITNNEMEALILENNLIKQNRPFYNILLRDDKSFPYIKVTSDKFPKVIKTRNKFDKNGIFFGPYTDVNFMNRYLKDINELNKIRDCNRNIEKSIQNGERPCLNFHIGICSAPCAKKISEEEYKKSVEKVVDFLKGNDRELYNFYKSKMTDASKELNFEEAAEYRDLMNNLSIIKERQNISIKRFNKNQHYVSYYFNDDIMIFTILIYQDGNFVKRESYEFDRQIDSVEDMYLSFVMQYYTDNSYLPEEIYLDLIDKTIDIDVLSETLSKENGRKVKIYSPKIGKKSDIIELAKSNSKEKMKFLELKLLKKNEVSEMGTKELELLLGISPINVIECYDVSNISGSDSVGVRVVFKNGKKSPSDYRKYKLQSNGKPDDYLSTYQMIERRLKYGDFPDLILLDGGKGHVSTIKTLLEKHNANISLYGIYKNDKHQTEGLADENQLYEIPKRSKLFRLLSDIQNEVHRFAINYHRKTREKSMVKSELDNISGIGEKRKIALIKAFGSVNNIRKASIEDLIKVDGMNRKSAESVIKYFLRRENDIEC